MVKPESNRCKSPTEDELLSDATYARVVDLFKQAGPTGLSCPQVIELLWPDLDAEENERCAAIMEHAITGNWPTTYGPFASEAEAE